MGIQKYRADEAGTPDANGAVPYYTRWMGGPSLALIRNCPTPFGPRTVYISGEPETYFSQPAKVIYQKKTISGYIMQKDGNFAFHIPVKS